MDFLNWILVAILAAVVLFMGRSMIPRVISFYFPGRRRLYFESGAEESPISEARREEVQPVIQKLEAMGFNRLGFMYDKPPLWARTSRELVLASPAEKAFASIGYRGNRLSYFFYTPFTGGQVVVTAYNAFRFFQKEDFVTTVVYSESLEEMLEVHKKQVQEFTGKGYVPYSDYDRKSFIEATHLYYKSPYLRRQLLVAGTVNLVLFLLVLFLFGISLRAAL